MVTTQQISSPHVARVDCNHERGLQTPLALVSEPSGPIRGDLGPFLARFGPGPVWTKMVPFGPAKERGERVAFVELGPYAILVAFRSTHWARKGAMWAENAQAGAKED